MSEKRLTKTMVSGFARKFEDGIESDVIGIGDLFAAKKILIEGNKYVGGWLLAIGFVLVGASMFFHYSLFANILTWVMFFTTGIGGWLLGRGTKYNWRGKLWEIRHRTRN